MRDQVQKLIAAPYTRLGLSCLALIAVVIGLDQASKIWALHALRQAPNGSVTILPILSFTLVGNKGMSFGLLSGTAFGRWFLTLFQLVAAGGLGYCMTKMRSPLLAVSLGMIAGGAVGNAVDRVRFGEVVDFIDFSGTHVFPWVFNIADSAISIGVVLLAWHFLRSETGKTG